MTILGIETSCDETAIAVVEVSGPATRPRVRVLSNVVASQAKLHAQFGGVVPHLAKREHQRNLVPVLLMALKEAKLRNPKHQIRNPKQIQNSKFKILDSILERELDLFARMMEYVLPLATPKIDAIAVTVGPGLAPALWVGVNFARALAYLWGRPLIPVNHLEGHIYTNLIPEIRANQKFEALNPKQIQNQKFQIPNRFEFRISNLEFPAIVLLVSGGHTELVLMGRYGDYRVLGETLDDAAGEAFDKVAKMMGLGFPGGPIVSKLAERGNPHVFNFPRPMLHSKDFNFSFSGLKTAVLYTLRGIKRVGERTKRDIAASFEQAVADVLVAKTLRAAKQYRAKTVMIGGGVAANKKLRAELGAALQRSFPSASYLLPSPSLTGDNALMIALAGWFNRKKKTPRWASIGANANLRLDD